MSTLRDCVFRNENAVRKYSLSEFCVMRLPKYYAQNATI